MKLRVRRALTVAVLLAGGAMMLASPNFACESFMGETAMSAVDFCFIFDCTGGILGGTIDPCNGGGQDSQGNTRPNILVDCPEEEE